MACSNRLPQPMSIEALCGDETGINAAATSFLESSVHPPLGISAREVAAAPTSTAPVNYEALMTGTSNCLIQAGHVLSLLAGNLETAAINAHRQSRRWDFTTMEIETRQREILDLIQKLLSKVQETWPPVLPASPDSPVQQTAFSSFEIKKTLLTSSLVAASEVETRVHDHQQEIPSSQVSPGHPSPDDNTTTSNDSDEDSDEKLYGINIEALKQRGKGSYHCPLGLRCYNGGVDKDGNLVLFNRNSTFLQHWNKHRKPWQCDIPGCPNPPEKQKFARRDGLERHKATVKHHVET